MTIHQYKQHIGLQYKTEEHGFSSFVDLSQTSSLASHIYFEAKKKHLYYDCFNENSMFCSKLLLNTQ